MLPKFVEDVIIVELTTSVASIEEASSIYVIKTIKIITNHQLRVGFVMLIICLLTEMNFEMHDVFHISYRSLRKI